MNKKIAFDNRLCYERDVIRQHDIHHHKLQTMLPTCQSPSRVYLDSNEPTRRAHLLLNRKRQQLEKEKQMDIYTQNQRLATKMEHILNRQENVILAAGTPQTPSLTSPRGGTKASTTVSPRKPVHSPAYVHMPGIRLNANQTPMVDCYLSQEFAMGRGNACKKDTLVNRGVQKQKQRRIAEENRRLKQRLKTQKPYYNTKKWDTQWQESSHKFQHLHQNTTVGHLLPKTSPVNKQHGGIARTSRSPLVGRRMKARHDLPTITTTPPMSTTGGTHSNASEQSVLSSGRSKSEEDDGPDVTEYPPFVLLEATTRKGVELTVEELQIEMCDPSSGIVQAGDRGLVVRGQWRDNVQGECYVGKDTLEKIAQEIDDLEMMIKLETISSLAGIGNFPRLSALLTEDELQQLLLKLVQVMNIQVIEESNELVITSRFIRSPKAVADRGESKSPYRAIRPRTCPSTIPSDVAPVPPDEYCSRQYDGNIEDIERNDQEIARFQAVLAKQLALVLNQERTRAGIRISGLYYTARYWFDPSASTLKATVTPTDPSKPLYTTKIPFSIKDVTTSLECINSEAQHPSIVAWERIFEWLEQL
ncbi:hypothetical protein Poli38472_009191 [Pythium oligandrum]|uniref:Uncharacterized protein n=1 Tax=Pythium oligandrum TaxID=41045 RepID=A0A8K1FL93_PYTOL|nr:hypothetical protein Poli38472_009191 [Pythium oligandrum]|eukprot:TMW65024.1 hypothetical protein Poli38472_009191 [Pythium oligandrum]